MKKVKKKKILPQYFRDVITSLVLKTVGEIVTTENYIEYHKKNPLDLY